VISVISCRPLNRIIKTLTFHLIFIGGRGIMMVWPSLAVIVSAVYRITEADERYTHATTVSVDGAILLLRHAQWNKSQVNYTAIRCQVKFIWSLFGILKQLQTTVNNVIMRTGKILAHCSIKTIKLIAILISSKNVSHDRLIDQSVNETDRN